jgi:type I restriction enzyme R subunit
MPIIFGGFVIGVITVSNFVFLEEKWPVLANLGETAEKNPHHDPNTSLIKLRMYGEMMVTLEKLPEPILPDFY